MIVRVCTIWFIKTMQASVLFLMKACTFVLFVKNLLLLSFKCLHLLIVMKRQNFWRMFDMDAIF